MDKNSVMLYILACYQCIRAFDSSNSSAEVLESVFMLPETSIIVHSFFPCFCTWFSSPCFCTWFSSMYFSPRVRQDEIYLHCNHCFPVAKAFGTMDSLTLPHKVLDLLNRISFLLSLLYFTNLQKVSNLQITTNGVFLNLMGCTPTLETSKRKGKGKIWKKMSGNPIGGEGNFSTSCCLRLICKALFSCFRGLQWSCSFCSDKLLIEVSDLQADYGLEQTGSIVASREIRELQHLLGDFSIELGWDVT